MVLALVMAAIGIVLIVASGQVGSFIVAQQGEGQRVPEPYARAVVAVCGAGFLALAVASMVL